MDFLTIVRIRNKMICERIILLHKERIYDEEESHDAFFNDDGSIGFE